MGAGVVPGRPRESVDHEDHLVDSDLAIVGEIMLPIRFAFVSRAETVGDVDKIHVQFAAKGQCSEFLDAMDSVRIVTTESNMESLERVRSGGDTNGAIVPAGAFSRGDFPLVDDDVAAALDDVGHAYRIKLLGSYPRAGDARNR